MLRLLAAFLLLVSTLWAEPSKNLKHWVEEFNAIDAQVPHTLSGWIPNEETLAFMEANIPRFDCPDQELVRTYYFRWWTYRKHIRQTPEGYVVTEFLPEVPWASKYNTINCPAGHQFREGRWLHEPKILEDYARFYFGGGGKPRQYSFWAADSILQLCKVRGDAGLGIELLDKLVDNHRAWEQSRKAEDGLFWQIDDRDGMEVSVGGSGKRPTINSYLYGDARAIAQLATLAKRSELAEEFQAKATTLRQLINRKLWCPEHQFYKTIPYAPEGRRLHHGKTCGEGRKDAPWVDVRELHGYTPWYFGIPEKANAGQGREVAWKQLQDPKGFAAPYGPTSAEQRHPIYKVSREGHECQWNGPSWPFATSITLTAMAHVLQDYPQQAITKADYLKHLQSYSNSHRLKLPNRKQVCWIDENLDPQTGEWLARALLQEKAKTSKDPGKLIKERGQHYNHSTFCDLIINGLVGLRPSLGKSFDVHPLVPEDTWPWFRMENIPYHAKRLTIQWDKDGSHYNIGKGLRVFAGGELLKASDALGKITVELP